jgi:hypothetical protein
MQFISDEFYGFVDWYISERTDNVKANEGIGRLKIYRLQQLYELARIVNEIFQFCSKRTQNLMEKTDQGIARETNRGKVR